MVGINTIIFDLGGVLIDWNPGYVFDENYFESKEQRDFFFNNVCTADWNENQDAGYPIAKATEEKLAEFPEWEKPIRDFYGRWVDMLEARPMRVRLPLLALIGALWGIIAGGSGGIFIFVIGLFFGAVLGGAVGMAVVPAFALPYYAVRRAGLIDTRHFLPLALGSTLTICAIVLGTVFR